jgi:hypothetical protein
MNLVTRISYTRLQNYFRGAPEKMEEAQMFFKEQGSILVMTEMRQQAPLGKSGFLRESITRHFTPKGFSVYPTMPYSKIVEEGSRPHIILPRTAQVLHFFMPSGAEIFATHVHHPGFAGRWFIRATKMLTVDRLRDLLDQIIKTIMGTK